MLESIIWQAASIFIVVPAFLGIFLLASSTDQLIVRYQNFMLARTMKPLKDEDFKNITWVIIGLKSLGVFLLMSSLGLSVGIFL